MTNSFISHRKKILADLNYFIKKVARLQQEVLPIPYSEARDSIIKQYGWSDTYAFDVWRKKEVEQATELEHCPKRKACLIKNAPENDVPVFIFQIIPEVIFTTEDGEDEYSLDELSSLLQDDPDYILETPFKLKSNKAFKFNKLEAICSIWDPKGYPIPPTGFEWRKPDCSCKKSYTYEVGKYAEKFRESYLLTTKDDLINWATKWGGVACFEKDVLDTLEDNDPIKKFLTRSYVVPPLW